ncbi:MAG: hypothetical protein BJ554DRAFT_948, partial [Olpidium bornovanus]
PASKSGPESLWQKEERVHRRGGAAPVARAPSVRCPGNTSVFAPRRFAPHSTALSPRTRAETCAGERGTRRARILVHYNATQAHALRALPCPRQKRATVAASIRGDGALTAMDHRVFLAAGHAGKSWVARATPARRHVTRGCAHRARWRRHRCAIAARRSAWQSARKDTPCGCGSGRFMQKTPLSAASRPSQRKEQGERRAGMAATSVPISAGGSSPAASICVPEDVTSKTKSPACAGVTLPP